MRPLCKASLEEGSWFRVDLDCSSCSLTIQPQQKTKNMTTLHLRKSIGRSPWRRGYLLIAVALALALFAPSRTAQAQLPSPSPDGGYPNGNTAEGDGALQSLTSGIDNTANGNTALFSNTTGSVNTVLGFAAGSNLTTGSNNIDIGNGGVAAEANTIRIGTAGTQTKTFIAGISGTGVSGAAVKINSSGQVGVAPSSERFKDAIKPMDKASEAILALKPVTFRYKHELDPEGIPQFGLVAEQVEKVNPALVARDADGKVYTVRYEAVNAMLLNEFLKEHRKVEQQDHKIQKQEATIAKQQKQIEALTTGLQKVSDQLELSKPAPRTVGNNQ